MIWYKIYCEQYIPVVLITRDQNGILNGLLTLAISTIDGQLVVAGGCQAEYHCWICTPEIANEFAMRAIRAVRSAFPLSKLTFRYLPPGTPTTWLENPEFNAICSLDAHRRPLIQLGAKRLAENALFRNKTIKNQLNRLNKKGPPEFKLIRNPIEFEELFPIIISFYDHRQAAIHGVPPFLSDVLKRKFYSTMMQQNPNLLHVTVLKAGKQIIAAHLGISGKSTLHLGITALNPVLARLSPSTLHLHFLITMLKDENFDVLDLTPGGDIYKERFANTFEDAHVLTVFPSVRYRTQEVIKDGFFRNAKKMLSAIGVAPERTKSLKTQLKATGIRLASGSFIKKAIRWICGDHEIRVYAFDISTGHIGTKADSINCNSLDDLLAYTPPHKKSIARKEFLSVSLRRLGDGERVYTYVENGRLLNYGWLIERQEKSFISEVKQEFFFPPNSACLYDFYTSPNARCRGLYTMSLQKMLKDISCVTETEKVFIFVLADNFPSRHVIEKLGFIYQYSLFERVRFGRSLKWSTTAEK